jgi:hypothetical protein
MSQMTNATLKLRTARFHILCEEGNPSCSENRNSWCIRIQSLEAEDALEAQQSFIYYPHIDGIVPVVWKTAVRSPTYGLIFRR